MNTLDVDEVDLRAEAEELRLRFRGPWLTQKLAAEYVGSKTVNAFYGWRKFHGIVARSNGTVLKADLDRVLRRKRVPRQMAVASLANLKRGRS